MSSGKGDSAATKSDDDTERKPPSQTDKFASRDLVDHALVLSLDKDSIPFQEIVEETSNKTDSGFKDNLPSDVTDKLKSNSDNTDDNSDDDLELKWEDEESDEQNIMPLENEEKATEDMSERNKPVGPDLVDTNLSRLDADDEKTEQINQNQLLKSTPFNKDTHLLPTSEIPKSKSPSNEIVRNDDISDNEDIIDENQLLESPKSDEIDENELLEIPDKEESLLEDDLINDDSASVKTDSQIIAEKLPNTEILGTVSAVTLKETVTEKLEPKSATSIANANISGLETTTQELSQVIMSTSSPNESLMDTSLNINTDHGLTKPDMMLEIPTQEIIELDDTDLLTSGSCNDDDKMEVDSNTDSFKTAIDTEMDVEEPILEKESDAIIVKPGVFRVLDAQESSKDGSETKKTEDVSEDDWCEIERRLEGFEESFSEESQLEKLSKKSENAESTPVEGADSNQSKKDEGKEIQPLTAAQKLVIETENKELLKTLQDTSKLDTTGDKMDVEDETLNREIKKQPQSNENMEKVDTTPESDLQCNIEKTTTNVEDETSLNPETESQPQSNLDTEKVCTIPKIDLQSNLEETKEESKEKETEPSSNLDQVLETKECDDKTDAVDLEPLSPSKSAKEMELQEESLKSDSEIPSNISQIEEMTAKSEEGLKDKSPKEQDVVVSTGIEQTPKLTDDNVVTIEEPMELQSSAAETSQSTEDKEISSTPKDIRKITLTEAIETTQSTVEDEEISATCVNVEKITIAETNKTSQSTADDKEISLTSKDVGEIISAENTEISQSTVEDKELSSSLKKLDKTTNQLAEKLADDEPKLFTDEDVPPTSEKSVSADNIVTPSTANRDNIVQTSTMEVEPIEVSQLSEQEIPNEVIQPSVISVDKVVAPSTAKDSDNVAQTSTMEVEASIVPQPTEQEIPSTSQEKESPPVVKSLGNIKVRSLASLMPFGQSSYVQPSNSINPPLEKEDEGISAIIATSAIDKASTTNEVQPSTSKVTEVEVQPSTSKISPDTEMQPTTSAEVPAASMDPDSDEVPEISDSLGLLAESSRVMEDDEDQDDDDDNDVDDDDEYDPEDESSNQMTAEHSEDSNAPQSETDQAKDQEEKEMDVESPTEEKGEDEFSFTCDKDAAIGEEKDVGMEVDEVTVQDEIEVTPEQIGNELTTDDVQPVEIAAESNETEKEKPKQTNAEPVKLTDKVAEETSVLKQLLSKEAKGKSSEAKTSPSKKLGIARPSNVLNIVELEESSSEDDIQEVKKDAATDKSSLKVTTAPTEATPDVASEVTVNDDRNNETAVKSDSKPSEDKSKPKLSLEIFSLDSDEEDSASAPAKDQQPPILTETDKPRAPNKCINIACASSGSVQCYKADAATIAYYDAAKRRKALVCEVCADIVVKRAELLVKGIKELTPLLELDTGKTSSELVEISDSDSEDECDTTAEPKETIGESGASFIEENLAKMINETWNKFCLDSRLTDAQDELNKDMEKLEAESKEIEAMLTECQVATDKLRNDLYATFEQQRRELPAIVMFDTPLSKYVRLEETLALQSEDTPQTRAKRRMSSATETPAKRPAIPLGYTPLDAMQLTQGNKSSQPTVENTKIDDDKDISVLKVSAEMAPSDLPPPGELIKPPLRPGMCVYTMRNALGSWIRSRVLEVNGKSAVIGMSQSFTVCRVKYEHKPKGSTKLSPARCLAYAEPATVRLTIGTRVVALFKDVQNPLKKDAFYSGIIAEVPNPVNNYRYLVFFDDGYAQYVMHRDTRVVCECSPLVWEEVHPVSREFVKEYLMAYPERPMVRLHAGQSLKTEWNGKWWASRVIQVDASLVQVHFEEDNRTEWIYRGSTRLAPLFLELRAAERHRARPMPRTKAQGRVNMPYVEYTRSDEQANKPEQPATPAPPSDREIRQRAVAKKSTALAQAPTSAPPPSNDSVTSRVVYYTPKNAVRPYKMTPHSCGPHCKRKDVLALKDLRTYNPLAKPLLSGWERQIVRFKGHKEVMYRAPCGRRLRNMRELHRYLRLIQSDMAVDLFDFTPHTHCLAEFVLNKCLVGKKDLSHGKENVPVPCVNYYDESLPEFCSYNTERTPTAGVPLNLDPEFLCGCDCTDDCEDKSKCACWQMTLEGARTIGLGGPNVGYRYKRLPEPLPSGIYECNSRCKCKQTCLNRVAQHPLQLKLQVFKTLNRGWGIRALNDVPKGSFLCVYAGNLLTDATANMDGLNEGDEYLAELDYIEVVEQMKEGYEEDIPEADKRLDKKNAGKEDSESEMSSSEEEDETPSKNEQEDGDFQPGYIGMGVSEFSKRLRKRDKNKKKKEERAKEKEKEADKTGDDCITISDDEEVREPSRFMAQAGMGKEFISKYRSVRSYFGKDEACYIMDAKVQGNIGRYLNHSCTPNVFVQNVFVDTHDPRFPWVAFFALSHIKAGTELTWNYNYDVGSVPGKILYCYCGAPNCRGRLL